MEPLVAEHDGFRPQGARAMAVTAVPEGFHTATACLILADVERGLDFWFFAGPRQG